MTQLPVEQLLTAPELLEKARLQGVKVGLRRFRYWQSERLIDPPIYLPGRGHIGYYTSHTLTRLLAIARGRQSLGELRRLDRRPTRQALTITVDVVASEPLPDGRVAHTLRDHSILIR
jgi:hypothetical protein